MHQGGDRAALTASSRRSAAVKNPRSSAGAAARGADFVSSLAKGLEILAAFEHGDVLGNQDLVARTGLPKATVSRLTGTLAVLGYLRHDERSRKYQIGTRILGLSASVQRHLGLQRIARPYMEALAAEVDMTVIMGARDRTALVFLDIVRPRYNELTVNTDAGSLVPLENTAIGLAWLVAAPVAERVRVLEALRRRHADDWSAVRQAIEDAHEQHQRRGFVVAQKSSGGDVNAVGVPLVLEADRGVFAFSCAGPSSQLPRQRLTRELGPRLVATVARIREALLRSPPALLVPREQIEP